MERRLEKKREWGFLDGTIKKYLNGIVSHHLNY
jgi:hypothetical protein